MKIKVDLSIFLFLILFIFTKQIKMYILVMIFAFVHEMGHLVIGLAFGWKPRLLKIMPFGFSIEFAPQITKIGEKQITTTQLYIRKIILALAGPLVNLFICLIGIFYPLKPEILFANFLILLFNMMPIYPLDGGRVLKNILQIFYGTRKANKYTHIISNVFFICLVIISSILIIIYENIAIFFIVLCLLGLIIQENKRYNTYNKIYKTIDKNNNYL